MIKSLQPISVVVAVLALSALPAAAEPPAWAYPMPIPGVKGPPDDGKAKSVPDSSLSFTRAQIGARGAPVTDWHPDEHPPMPDVVAKVKTQGVLACGYCHLPTGGGRPENASIAGLTPAYIKQQVLAFRNGERPGSEPKRGPQNGMITVAKAVSDADLEIAAAYFSALKPTSFIKVIEAETVPKTIVVGGILAKAPEGGTEPIGHRIVEIPDELERFENRDSRTPYTAYVPVGSLKKGADLVATGGNGKTVQCLICHGPELKGLADIPRIAGRSPSYLMRQLYDIRAGTRTGGASVLMKATVLNLTDEDMLAIVAYLASREP